MTRADTLQRLAQMCRNVRPAESSPVIEPSGQPPLDRFLPGGGWQAGTIVELLPEQQGIGELQLLMPTLARMTHAQRHVALIAPPYVPFAPGWLRHGVRIDHLLIIRAEQADGLWAIEQTLRCRAFGAVLAWPAQIKDREIRRLQLAAAAGGSIGFIYRLFHASLQASPAAIRMKLRAKPNDELRIEVLKCRGGHGGIIVCARNGREETLPTPAQQAMPMHTATNPSAENLPIMSSLANRMVPGTTHSHRACTPAAR